MTELSIDIAEVERMGQRGSSLLRSIQNEELPALDLLVREALQNSLDAKREGFSNVQVDLNLKTFNKNEVLQYFEGLQDTIGNFFTETKQKALTISDSNTEGLTGPLSYEEMESRDDQGNLLNLIYEIGRPQEKEGAGGSWGLGKTVYFRAGIGLVIYYSRILKEDNTYESRLAACLIENEEKIEEETFIPYSSDHKLKRGIAWWGRSEGDKTVPITEENEIDLILQSFNIEPYKNEETGTTVILPFIQEKNLLGENGDRQQLPWESSIEKYLKIAVQRWYAPRLNNTYYPYGGRLECAVNNDFVTREKMEPVFLLMQNLYNLTVDEDGHKEKLQEIEYYVEDINTRGILKESEAGKLSFAIVHEDKLRMAPPDNLPSPYRYFDIVNYGENENYPIISHTRMPGMIVSYNTSGGWVNKVNTQDEHHYLIGIFVPNSTNEITDVHFREWTPNVEAYLRSTEKADHRSWADAPYRGHRLNLVDRIQKTLTKRINNKIGRKDKPTDTQRDAQLSNIVGQAILPPRGYGKSSGKAGGKTGGGTSFGGRKDFSYKIQDINIHSINETEISFSIKSSGNNAAMLEISALSEQGTVRADKWEKDIETRFPFSVKQITLEEDVGVEPIVTEEFGRSYGEVLDLPESKDEVHGKILVENDDPLIQMKISINKATTLERTENE
ncbi:hypothetical protein [Salimicrobium humidisoli]|uniref:Histidine kinase-, DNA gyrase B-, and HSP90-like ATPase n=1 Tax=Salimicrobium humidisoli TaxID=2029857 RepID=A0ABX4HUK1_9BACI|nr:hypothetical protein [Salimicrobium humidisoli]PBB06921.1 hypothetical protein CKW00_00225 [Salimicrobium humidisoli]